MGGSFAFVERNDPHIYIYICGDWKVGRGSGFIYYPNLPGKRDSPPSVGAIKLIYV